MTDDKEVARREKRILTRALCTYGKEVQMWKFVEELGELITAMARMRIAELSPQQERGNERDNLAEEIADAGITAEYAIETYGIKDMVRRWRHTKCARLKTRMEEENARAKPL